MTTTTPTKPARDERVTIRTSQAERARWAAAARAQRMTLSRWIRRALDQRAADDITAAGTAAADSPEAARQWLITEITNRLGQMSTHHLMSIACAVTASMHNREGSL